MEENLIVDRRRPRSDFSENSEPEAGAAWAITADLGVLVDTSTFDENVQPVEEATLPVSGHLTDARPTIEYRASTLPSYSEPPPGNRPRLARVFAGLVVLSLISGLVWLAATSSENDNGGFSSVPAGDDTPPQAAERTEASAPVFSQSSEDDDDSEIGQFTGGNPVADQVPAGPEVEQPGSEVDEVDVDGDTSTDGADSQNEPTPQTGADAQNKPTPQAGADSPEAESPTSGSTESSNDDESPQTVDTPMPVTPPREPAIAITRVQTQSRTNNGVLAGVGVTLVSEPAGQISTATSSRSGLAFVSMPVGCGTLTFVAPTGHQIISPAGGSIRVCSQESDIAQSASFNPIEGSSAALATTAVAWDTSPGSCDANDKRSLSADVTHTGSAALQVRMRILDSLENVVHQSHVFTIEPNNSTPVELQGIPATGTLTARIVKASNSETIDEQSRRFNPC